MPLKSVSKPEVTLLKVIGSIAVIGTVAALKYKVDGTVVSSVMSRSKKNPLRPTDVTCDAEGRIENWNSILKIIQQRGVDPSFRAKIWPFLLGVYSPRSTTAERDAELDRLVCLYSKLVLICEELDGIMKSEKRAEGAAAAREKARANAFNPPPNFATTAASLSSSSPEKEKNGSPGNVAAFAEAHRIIVLDSVRTDLRTHPTNATLPSQSPPPPSKTTTATKKTKNTTTTNGDTTTTADRNGVSWPKNIKISEKSSAAPSAALMSVLPVSIGEGLPELMLVDPPQPLPAEAVALGQLPMWRSELAVTTIDGATHVSPATRRLMMRLVNILSAYAVHDPESGYCQGMSDLGAVFVQMMDNDAVAFACFERLMRDARRNFRHDETGIKSQLEKISQIVSDTAPAVYKKLEQLGAADCMFAYRMVLVMARRELDVENTLILWETKWAFEAGAAAEKKTINNSGGGGGSGSSNNNSNGGGGLGKSVASTGVVPEIPSLSTSTTITSSSSSSSSPSTATTAAAANNSFNEVLLPPSSAASSTVFSTTVASMDAATKEAASSLRNANRNEVENRPASRIISPSSLSSSSQPSPPPPSLPLSKTTKGTSGNGRQLTSSTSTSSTSSQQQQQQQQQKQDRQPPPDFIVHFVVAVIKSQSTKILKQCHENDDLLRLFSAVKIDFWAMLEMARKLNKAYAQGIVVLRRL